MSNNGLPELLELEERGERRYRVRHPGASPEGRDVIFGGQILAQMIMASDANAGGAKDVKSIHAIFARAGTYAEPMDIEVEPIQAGRTWASDTLTARQGERLLCRALVLLNIDDPDLMRHETRAPAVPKPADLQPGDALLYPEVEMRPVPEADTPAPDGVPTMAFWMRYPRKLDSVAANQAILAYCTNGQLIGLAMRPHSDKVKISDAHRSVSTGVIGHIVHFHERPDVSEWLLVTHEAPYAGRGRIFGRGLVFTEDGRLVAAFEQDSMVRAVEGGLDPKRAM